MQISAERAETIKIYFYFFLKKDLLKKAKYIFNYKNLARAYK